MSANYYPVSPSLKNHKITGLTSSYKFRAFLAILAIVLFFVLYFALVVGLGYLVYYAIYYDMGNVNKWSIFLKVGAILGSAMLFVFTLKFIFKLKNHKAENRIKLNKAEHPILWEFVDKICNETGAPKPRNIYVDPDVNAYVSYSNMWLSLFLPIKKELTIGLGLVSCLNLSEFKAVVTHEFGHFAQRSMKIGSYIISANTIIHDMIFDRDKWDDLLDQWRGTDLRLSAAAWVITPVIWVIRQVLALFYQFLNIMYSSLSREMEFNADKVAVSTSGSEAIVSALWKLDPGSAYWNNTLGHAYNASQKNQFVSNLYQHNSAALQRDATILEDRHKALPADNRGVKQYFSTSEVSKAGMYASHPPNDQREKSAKTPFIECDTDERSPWILFGNIDSLQQEMTSLVYDKYLNKKPENFVSAQEFEQFISEESKGKELLEEYQNTFENRFLHIGEKEELEKVAGKLNGNTKELVSNLKEDLTKLMTPVKEIEALMQKAVDISNGTTSDRAFEFNGVSYTKKNLQNGYEKLVQEREKLLNESFKEWDLQFCAINLMTARKKGKQERILDLFEQHKAISALYKAMATVKGTVYGELNMLQARSEVSENEVRNFGRRVNDLVFSLNDELAKFDEISFTPLPNIETREELKLSIIDAEGFKKFRGNLFDKNGGFQTVMLPVENGINHCQRIEQKSIGVILWFMHEMDN